jgi:hypothetical protein
MSSSIEDILEKKVLRRKSVTSIDGGDSVEAITLACCAVLS